MCVGTKRSALVTRASFFAATGAAALPLFTEPARALDRVASAADPVTLTAAPTTAANTRAIEIARGSHFVNAQYAAVVKLARSIGDQRLRSDVMELLVNQQPKYVKRYPDDAARSALRDRLVSSGLLKPGTRVEAIFPIAAGANGLPFWAAPGSADSSHHAYPGGLAVHELFNATTAERFATTYDAIYFAGERTVDRDTVVAAALYHDVMKTVVFQYNDDGTFFKEDDVAETGAHHCLSGAEAIVRGRDPRFVTVLLSAHASPSLGDEEKVVKWCRAAAMIAGVDPVEYGLLRRDGSGYALAHLPSIEDFVNNLSDHDFVLSVHAAHEVIPRIDAMAPEFGIASGPDTRWWRLRILSNGSIIALYHELTRGENRFKRAVMAAGGYVVR